MISASLLSSTPGPDRRAVTILVALALVGTSFPAAAAPQDDEFPTTAGDAQRFYESWIEDWTSGPAEMFMTVEEHEIWDTLQTREQKRDFIEWFWDRRDPDGRQVGNEFKEQFYENVAEANDSYREIPKGWKSDRGRVHIMFGDPIYVSRRTQAEVLGRAGSAQFEIWSYSNLGSNLAFQGVSGEFLVYFIEVRIGRFEIWDYQWGPGVWDRNIRMAFDWTIEASIIDPRMPFEPGSTPGSYVREITEGTMPLEIPLDAWSDVGGGGAVSVPVQIKLGDLLFQPDGEEYVAGIEATLSARPQGPGDAVQATASWEIRLGQDDLLAVGNGSFVAPLTVATGVGTVDAEMVVRHPIAATESIWQQAVQVSDDQATSVVLGQTVLTLNPTDPSAVGILMSDDGIFDSGGLLVIGAWMRGGQADPDAVSVQLVTAEGSTVLDLESVAWLGGTAGPLLAQARLPELDSGEHELRVDFGSGFESVTTQITVER